MYLSNDQHAQTDRYLVVFWIVYFNTLRVHAAQQKTRRNLPVVKFSNGHRFPFITDRGLDPLLFLIRLYRLGTTAQRQPFGSVNKPMLYYAARVCIRSSTHPSVKMYRGGLCTYEYLLYILVRTLVATSNFPRKTTKTYRPRLLEKMIFSKIKKSVRTQAHHDTSSMHTIREESQRVHLFVHSTAASR